MGDETTKIFLNSKGSRNGVNGDLAAFLDYIEGKAPRGKFTETIAGAVEEAKEDKEMKVEYMTYFMELREREERGRVEGRAEGRAEGRVEGRTEGEKNTILAMLKHGMPAETIAQIVGWTNERVRELGRLNGIL